MTNHIKAERIWASAYRPVEFTATENEHLLGCSECQHSLLDNARHPICSSQGMATVAIVDDSKDIVELLEVILTGQHKCVTFTDPQEFLETFRPGEYALVLLDLAMPGCDGYEAFRRIRLLDTRVLVAALTGTAQVSEQEKALSTGFCDYFIKPIIDIERFRERVYSYVSKCSNPPYKEETPAA